MNLVIVGANEPSFVLPCNTLCMTGPFLCITGCSEHLCYVGEHTKLDNAYMKVYWPKQPHALEYHVDSEPDWRFTRETTEPSSPSSLQEAMVSRLQDGLQDLINVP